MRSLVLYSCLAAGLLLAGPLLGGNLARAEYVPAETPQRIATASLSQVEPAAAQPAAEMWSEGDDEHGRPLLDEEPGQPISPGSASHGSESSSHAASGSTTGPSSGPVSVTNLAITAPPDGAARLILAHPAYHPTPFADRPFHPPRAGR